MFIANNSENTLQDAEHIADQRKSRTTVRANCRQSRADTESTEAIKRNHDESLPHNPRPSLGKLYSNLF